MVATLIDYNPGAGFATLGAGLAGAHVIGYAGEYMPCYMKNGPTRKKPVGVNDSADIVWLRIPGKYTLPEDQARMINEAFDMANHVTIIESIKKPAVRIDAEYVRTYSVRHDSESIGTGSTRWRYFTLVSNTVDVTNIEISKRRVSANWSGLKGKRVSETTRFVSEFMRGLMASVAETFPHGAMVGEHGHVSVYPFGGPAQAPNSNYSAYLVYRGGYRIIDIDDMRRIYRIPDNYVLPDAKRKAALAIGSGTDYMAARFFVGEVIKRLS